MASQQVTVSASALYEVLSALNGPGHLIRELQTLQLLSLTREDNAINILTEEYNAWVQASIDAESQPAKES